MFGQNRVRWHFAHHDDAQAIFATFQAIFCQQIDDTCCLWQSTHEWHHQFHVGQSHFITDAAHRQTFHFKCCTEILCDVARCATEAQHRIFFIRFVAGTTNQFFVLIGFEVRQTHDDFFRPERSSDRCNAFCQFVDIKRFRRSMTTGHGFHCFFERRINIRVFQNGFRMDADIVIDDEFQTRQANTFVWYGLEIESQLRVTDVQHDFYRQRRQLTTDFLSDFCFQQTVVNLAFIAFGTRYGDQCAVFQHFCRIATANHCRHTQFARNNRCMAGTAAAVSDDRRSTFHDRFPVRVCHVSNQHVTRLNTFHFRRIIDHAHRTGTDFLTNRTAGGQHSTAAFQAEFLLRVMGFFLRLHSFRTCLQDVQFAVTAIFTPFDIHRTAIVFLDDHGVFRQLNDFTVFQRIAVTQFDWYIHGFHRAASFGFACEFHLDQFGTDVFTDYRQFAQFQHRFVNVEFVRVNRTLHHGFTQTIAGSDEYHIFETGFSIDGEHHTGSACIRTHHTLNTGGQRNFGVREAFVNAVRNRTVVIQRREYVFDCFQHVIDTDHIQESFLLTCKGCVRQIFRCRRRTHRKRHFAFGVSYQTVIKRFDFRQQTWLERCFNDPLTDFRTGFRQFFHVIDIQRCQTLFDFFCQRAFAVFAVFEKITESLRCGSETTRHTDTGSCQLADHFTQRSIFTTDRLHIGHPQFFKRSNVHGFFYCVRHNNPILMIRNLSQRDLHHAPGIFFILVRTGNDKMHYCCSILHAVLQN